MRSFMANKFKPVFGLALLLAACSHQELRFYMLEPASDSTPPVQSLSAATVVGLGPVHLPEYLNRPQMVIAVGEHQYRFDEQHRWAERLEDNVSRVLAQNVQRLLGVQQLIRYPWSQRQSLDYQITLDVLSFHHSAGQQTELKAQWQVRQADKPMASKLFECRLPASDHPEAIVATHSQCLQDLAAELAGAVRQLSVAAR